MSSISPLFVFMFLFLFFLHPTCFLLFSIALFVLLPDFLHTSASSVKCKCKSSIHSSCHFHSFLSCEDDWWLKWDSIRHSMKGSPLMKGSQKKSRKEQNKLQQHIKQQNLTPSKNTKNRRRHYKEIRQTEAFNT